MCFYCIEILEDSFFFPIDIYKACEESDGCDSGYISNGLCFVLRPQAGTRHWSGLLLIRMSYLDIFGGMENALKSISQSMCNFSCRGYFLLAVQSEKVYVTKKRPWFLRRGVMQWVMVHNSSPLWPPNVDLIEICANLCICHNTWKQFMLIRFYSLLHFLICLFSL